MKPASPDARTFTLAIRRPAAAVYAFVSNPQNLPLWATAFCQSVRRLDNGWVIETPLGEMKLRFAPQNAFGILDHYLNPSPETEIYVPMRVVTQGHTSQVLFTLMRQAGISDTAFEEDAAMVERDLNHLKAVLEQQAPA